MTGRKPEAPPTRQRTTCPSAVISPTTGRPTKGSTAVPRPPLVDRSAKVYVDGPVHTQTIWSLVKRGIGGTHHAVSAKYLQS